MTARSTWSRKAGAFLFALVLSIIAFGPGLDSLICGDEGRGGAVAAEMAVGASIEAGQSGHEPDGHEPGSLSCVHGHCHHGQACVPAEPAVAAEPVVRAAAHKLARSAVRTSDPQFHLKRPPRA